MALSYALDLRHWGSDRIYEIRCLFVFVAVGLNALLIFYTFILYYSAASLG